VTQDVVSTHLEDLHFNRALSLWKMYRIKWKRFERPRHRCENGVRMWIL